VPAQHVLGPTSRRNTHVVRGTTTEHSVRSRSCSARKPIPLDIAWIVDGKVLAVDTLTPCTEPNQDQCPRWTSPSAVDALLEVPAHSLATITPGMAITIEEQP
jgi:uncharacterized membrane protein (UPF0127 family)